MNPTPNDAPDIFTDLFAKSDDTRLNDPRYAVQQQPDEKSWPMLGSKEKMAEVFEKVVRSKFPTDAEIVRYRTQGQHVDPVTKKVQPGHRYRIETGSREVDGFVGQVKEAQWAIQVLTMLNKGNESSFIGALQLSQGNGDWVPMQVQTRFNREMRMNGRRILSANALPPNFRPPVKESEWSPDMLAENPLEQAYPVGVEVMEYAILWVDKRNERDLPPMGPDGKPIQDQIVSVQVQGGGSDPALTAALMAQGEKLGELAQGVKALAEKGPASPSATQPVGQGPQNPHLRK